MKGRLLQMIHIFIECKITVGCRPCTCPSIQVENSQDHGRLSISLDEDALKITVGCGVLLCGVCGVCDVCDVCRVCRVCGVVWCGVVWEREEGVSSPLSSLLVFLSLPFSLSFSFSVFISFSSHCVKR